MSTSPKDLSEGDRVVARAMGAFAQLRANLANISRLPAVPSTNSTELEQEDQTFTEESDLAGVGFIAPTGVDANSQQAQTKISKLRKQLLGKRLRDGDNGLERKEARPKKANVSRRGTTQTSDDDANSDEEEGRSRVGKKERIPFRVADVDNADHDGQGPKFTKDDASVEKLPTSYLDELLVARAKKKKRKKVNPNR